MTGIGDKKTSQGQFLHLRMLKVNFRMHFHNSSAPIEKHFKQKIQPFNLLNQIESHSISLVIASPTSNLVTGYRIIIQNHKLLEGMSIKFSEISYKCYQARI
ncbi:CLUMA_CG005824, isoform A [Clunio marinus]|uniref:CLUMA_CG005824, isoform A n=1 Tax=Clunio marinus TaxID=568069 RepID=A0A1J1HVW5_9DIPT|nr:CLUMA_CG005824, isoform A [Clunio marinus]